MHAKKRYGLVALCCATILAIYFIILKRLISHDGNFEGKMQSSANFMQFNRIDLFSKFDNNQTSSCTMSTCFDISRCEKSFKIHIHDVHKHDVDNHVSETYSKVLQIIKDSSLYTSNPKEACIFVLALDTMDRDPLSPDYLKNMPNKIADLSPDIWNGGKNHIIFNMYYGTWPNYDLQDIGFNVGHAILARASSATKYFRPSFDIALPLFHKQLPLRTPDSNKNIPVLSLKNKYLLVFKGKRYVYGIGSETRNSLYHLHNGRDIIMLTTCKHGTDWKYMQDDRCSQDNENYDKWDYPSLLTNSTFCLVPRGRRLGSYRFLETLEAGCIPVILSDGWTLPFSQIIHWNSVVIWANERQFLHLPDILRSIPLSRIFQMKQRAKLLYKMYFSSVQNIVMTSLHIIRSRLQRWDQNSTSLSRDHMSRDPFSFPSPSIVTPQFTGIINVNKDSRIDLGRLNSLIAAITRSELCSEILLLWYKNEELPVLNKLVNKISVTLVDMRDKKFSDRFRLASKSQSQVVYMIDSNVLLTTNQIDFSLEVFGGFPSRIVGFHARTHFWKSETQKWQFSSKSHNHYSMILLDAFIIHRAYLESYALWAPTPCWRIVEENPGCHDILLNIFVSEMSAKSPVLLSNIQPLQPNSSLFSIRQICINSFASYFGHLPLVRSNIQFDPVLYKDTMTINKKFYPDLEKI